MNLNAMIVIGDVGRDLFESIWLFLIDQFWSLVFDIHHDYYKLLWCQLNTSFKYYSEIQIHQKIIVSTKVVFTEAQTNKLIAFVNCLKMEMKIIEKTTYPLFKKLNHLIQQLSYNTDKQSLQFEKQYLMEQTEQSIKRKTKAELFAHYEQKQVQAVQSRITENIQIIPKKKTMSDSNLILGCLKNHFIFYNLSESELQNIKDKMFYCNIDEGAFVFQTGQIGFCFFIVERGILDLMVDDKPKKEIKSSDGFGQLALLYNTQRTCSVKARESSTLWLIDRQTFREAVEEVIIRDYNQNRKCLEGIRFFTNLSNDQKDIIASALITQKFYKNQTIIQQGDPGSSLYYIKEGVTSVFKGTKFIRKLGKGDSFGQQSLYYNTMRQLSIKADDQVTCLVLGRDTLNRVLNDKIYDVTFKNFIKWAFEKNPLISKLNKAQTEKVIEAMKISSFKANQSIFRKGVSGFQKIVVIIEGSLKKMKNGTIVANKGQCWGQQYLIDANKTKTLQDEIVMQTYGVLAEITDTIFFQCIGGVSFEEVIKKVEKSKEKMMPHFQNNIKKQTMNLRLQDLIYVNKLSDGQFGGIYLVRDPDKNLYAVKALSKSLLEEYEVQKFINEEKKILNTISFPFIIQLGRTFQTDNILFYLEQYICGQDFYEVMRSIGLLSTEDSQFYGASIVSLLQFFNDNQIVSRDIKPENFMIDSKGYMKLINLSTAKIIRTQNNQMSKTFTIIGTPHYMAPDIILGKGYNNLVDLWSLGVCLYQFLCGVLPFGDSAEGPYDIYEEIMQSELKFPEFLNDKKAKKLIEQLLNHNPQQRHGGSFAILKSHPWFQDFSWNDLLMKNDKKLEPPYVPEVNLRNVKDMAAEASESFLQSLKTLENRPDQAEEDSEPSKDQFQWASFGEVIDLSQSSI